MTNEAKVGAFTLTGIAIFAFILVHLSGFSFGASKDYTLYVGFNQVIGLNPGTELRYAGVAAGRIEDIKADGVGVTVTAKVQPEVKIPRGSVFTIAASGILGEKFVNISPVHDKGDYLQDGEYIIGLDEQGMDNMMANLNKTIEQVQTLLTAMNDVLGNKRFSSAMLDTTENVRDMTRNLSELTGVMSSLAAQNQSEISGMVHNMNMMTASLMQASGEVERMLHDFAGDGKTAANLRAAVENMAATSARIEKMCASLEGVVTDPQTAEDLKATLHNVRGVTGKTDKMLGKLNNIKTEGGLETMYSGKEKDWRTNFDYRIGSEDGFFLFGINDIGEGNDVNVQLGAKKGAITGRAGVVESKAGLGVDFSAGSRWKFSADAADPNEVKVKARVQYRALEDTYLFSEVRNLNDSKKRATFFGLRQIF